jgi:hypothetical protein
VFRVSLVLLLIGVLAFFVFIAILFWWVGTNDIDESRAAGLMAGIGIGGLLRRRGRDYTEADVASAYEAVTGSRLIVGRPLDLRRMRGGVTNRLTPTDEDRAKYGEFRFVVQTKRPRDPVHDVIRPRGESPSPGGVYWGEVPRDGNEGPDEPRWGLVKYLGNVKVVWFTDERELDERWQVLDNVLEELKRAAPLQRPDVGADV